ncbi:MAG TPA: hypothetical protein VEL51_21870 [Vicinamibacterales bacterium]|nr:hypothetical protein [Vicinamibacterales bacterium]
MKMLKALALAALLAIPSGVSAQTAAPAPDVLGTWDATFNVHQGAIPAKFTLKKDGDKIVGTIASQAGETAIQAEVKDKALLIWFTFQAQNGPTPIEMTGTVDGDKIKGTLMASGSPAGDWLATRAREPSTTSTKTEIPSTPPTTSTPTLAGDWNVSVELPNMTANPTLALKQDDEKLTGDYVSAQYGKFPLTGTVKGSDVTFSFSMSIEGNAVGVTYTGTVQKDGSLKGSVNYGDVMSGTFLATRKK